MVVVDVLVVVDVVEEEPIDTVDRDLIDYVELVVLFFFSI